MYNYPIKQEINLGYSSRILNKSISKVILEYIYEKYKNQNTIDNYKRYLKHYSEYVGVNILKDLEIPYPDLRLKTAKFISSYKSDNTKRLVIAALKGFYEYIIDVYNYPKSPVPPVRLTPRQNKSLTPSPALNEIREIIKKLNYYKELSRTDYLTYALTYTLATTSLRISECLQITKEMVQKGTIRITQKRGKVRELELPDKTKNILNEFIKTYQNSSLYIFTGSRGRILKRQNAYKYIKTATKKFGCHSFRKSVIEILISKGHHPHEVAKVSGHQGIDMIFYYDNQTDKPRIHKELDFL